MSSEFTPYVGESEQTSRDVLNHVRELIWLRDRATKAQDHQLAGSYYARARTVTFEYIVRAGHGDINTIQRLAKLCLPSFDPTLSRITINQESVDPYQRGWQGGPPPAAGAAAVAVTSASQRCCTCPAAGFKRERPEQHADVCPMSERAQQNVNITVQTHVPTNVTPAEQAHLISQQLKGIERRGR